MAKNKKQELDSVYVLKIVLYLIIGSQWLKIEMRSGTQIPIPLGALIGLLFAAHEHFILDRKVEYAVLLVAMFVGFWVPVGLVLNWN
jgi:hypothetical protein